MTLVRVDTGRVVRALALVVVVVVAAHLVAEGLIGGLGAGGEAGAAEALRAHLDLNGEGNVPTAVNAALLVIGGGLLALNGLADRARRMPGGWGWGVLAAVFVLLALDESLSWHERLIEPARAVVGDAGPLHFAWIVPYGIGVAVLGICLRGFLGRLDGPTRRAVLAAAALYLGGALGLEALGGWVAPDGGGALAALQAVEETLELIGLVLLAGALLRRLAAVPGGAAVVIADGPAGEAGPPRGR